MAILTGSLTDVSSPSKGFEKFAPQSKFMSEIAYNPKDNSMDITFHSGTKIHYIQVTPTTFLSFKSSPTHDAYYSRAIKGNLPSSKIIDKSIGRNKSAPLKEVNALDRGLGKKTGLLNNGPGTKPVYGTVNRAFAAPKPTNSLDWWN